MNSTREEKLEAFGRLLDIMDELREKCPWDRKQTYASLRPQSLEEVYELSDALLHEDDHEIMKELGDVLLHVVFYAKIGSERELYDIKDVIDRLCDKLIYRHPHVFGEVKANDAETVVQNWEMLKTKEKDGNKTVLSGVPSALPSLLKAYRIQDKAAAVGFDWKQREDVWEKVHEEVDELRAELDHDDKQKSMDEMGDFLFAVVNAARKYKINPDTALEHTCEKFIRRFTYIEQQTIRKGHNMTDLPLEVLDALWDEAKTLGM